MALRHIPVAPLPLDRFRPLLTEAERAELDEVRERSRRLLAGRVVWNVNSTASGGGVAELLRSLLAYTRGAGVDVRWVVVDGKPDFFSLTKRLHNRLHGVPGDGGPLGEAEHELYQRTLAAAARELHALVKPGDTVLLHDPQTAGLIPALTDGVRVVWRSHIGRDTQNEWTEEAWRFLRPYIEGADGWVFSRADYAPPGLDPDRVVIVTPSIDVFSPKNQELEAPTVAAILAVAGLQPAAASGGAPVFTHVDGSPGRVDRLAELDGDPVPPGVALVTQVSRWDRLKDPIGVLAGFVRYVAPRTDAHLMLAGPATAAVSDDPEGDEVLADVRRVRAELEPALRQRVHLACLPMEDAEENGAIVNALQRRSTIVVQKSLAEGFGLTVGEAMWKRRPLVASAVGGICDQIEDAVSGVLLRDPADLEAYGAAVVALLADPGRAAVLGAAAHERVRERFMSVRHLIAYVRMLEHIQAAGAAAAVTAR
ncbi:MAG: trehalose synthase [Solirubrobacteraceae bacterium]|jgi:trehalose synthase|nr:trehalose synthase [Solirubrobacteraceae bacterium]